MNIFEQQRQRVSDDDTILFILTETVNSYEFNIIRKRMMNDVIEVQFEPSGTGRSASLRFKNKKDETIPQEIELVTSDEVVDRTRSSTGRFTEQELRESIENLLHEHEGLLRNAES